MHKFRSFTLVEMIIVIVLIGIMLSITLNISGNQTKELRFRIARENFLANYNSFIIRAITTNSSDSQLIFTKDSSGPIYPSGSNINSLSLEPTPTIKISSFNASSGAFVDQVLSFDANAGKCNLFGTTNITDTTVIFTLQYIPKPDIERCYELNLSTCKLRPCP